MANTITLVQSSPYSAIVQLDGTGTMYLEKIVGMTSATILYLFRLAAGPLKAFLTNTYDWSTLQKDPRLVIRRVYSKASASITTDPVVAGTTAYDIGITVANNTAPAGHIVFDLSNGTYSSALVEIRFVPSSQL